MFAPTLLTPLPPEGKPGSARVVPRARRGLEPEGSLPLGQRHALA
jgi:hypothetical protein